MSDRIGPGFPKRILRDDGSVVDTDPLIMHAAAFLDGMPQGERVSPVEMAQGLGVPTDRAVAILDQLAALGHTAAGGVDGERPIFDPDGPTVPPDTP